MVRDYDSMTYKNRLRSCSESKAKNEIDIQNQSHSIQLSI